jgi:outer membrane biogenesis lipoprotein LolB
MKSSVAVLTAMASLLLPACASTSAVVADNVPTWLGGMPKDVPPRPGTAEYDAWQKKRAEEAAAIKSK